MSRAQEGETFATAKGQNAGYFNNAQNSYTNAQADVNDFSDQLAKYKASNPYVTGGAFQTATNQQTANTTDALARSAGTRLQGQALRTGNNSAGAIAATEAMNQQGTRDINADEAKATQERIGAGAAYNANALSASAKPEEMEASLAAGQGGLGEGTLNTQQKAGETPSFFDEFGNAVAQGLGKGVTSGFAKG